MLFAIFTLGLGFGLGLTVVGLFCALDWMMKMAIEENEDN